MNLSVPKTQCLLVIAYFVKNDYKDPNTSIFD